jgi:glycosyltransferase involved in cell wall biosynthesis
MFLYFIFMLCFNLSNIALSSFSGVPRISIITSIYDGDQFIESFLTDITRQTIFHECELILINANSPGHEETVIKKFVARFPNIRYKRLTQDPGLYGVWNMGIKLARGQFITNANLDDRLAPQCYQVHADALLKNPEVVLVYSDKYMTHKPNETFEKHTAPYVTNLSQFSPENMGNSLPSNNPMWRKSVHSRYGFFNEKYKSAGDWEMWLRIVEGGDKFLKINDVFCLSYLNPKGLSTGKLGDLPAREVLEIAENYKHVLSHSNLSASEILKLAVEKWNKEVIHKVTR